MNRLQTIKKLFSEFREVEYAVLRNYECLEGKAEFESIDTIISERTMHKAHEILISNGFQKRKLGYSKKHRSYFKLVDGKWLSLDIQVGGIHWNDVAYLDDSILVNKKKHKFFYVLGDNDAFVMYLLHSILGKRRFKPKYQEILKNLEIDEEFVYAKVKKTFRNGKKLVRLAREGRFNEILKKKYSLVGKFVLKNPWNFSLLFLRWLKWKKFGKSWPLISFIGPDGSGKSTAAKRLNEYFKSMNKKTSMIYTGRGRNQILPIRKIGNFYKGKERKKDARNTENKKKKKVKVFRRILYNLAAPVFVLDLLLRYFFVIMPKRKKRTIVITDRYCSDIFLMENVPIWLRKFYIMLFPKPTITINMHNDAKTLNQRRPEESIEGLERQLRLFDKLGRYFKPIRVKSVDMKKDNEKITEIVSEKLAQGWWY